MNARVRTKASVVALSICLVPAVQAQQPTAIVPLSVILHVPSLADSIEEIAGSHVRVLEARVVEVLDPRAVLVEAATKYRTLRGQRDRIVVFLQEKSTRNAPELALGSTVTLVGTARTLVSLRATNEVPWPVRLTQEEIRKLEVSGAIVDGAIETAEGRTIAGR